MKIRQDMISPHFSLSELSRSATALRFGIDNIPGPVETENLILFAQHILEPVRHHFAIPFSPSSGFRSRQVNGLVGSKPSSQHIHGQAVDFEIPSISNRDLAQWIRENLNFDQLILEYYRANEPKSGWVHCSYVAGHNRKICRIYDGKVYKEF